MRTRELALVDIDDVIADTTDAIRLHINERMGVNLTPESYAVSGSYWGYYETVWQAAGITAVHELMADYQTAMTLTQDHVQPVTGAVEGLGYLHDTYFDLAAGTSRDVSQEAATKRWLNQWFPGMFKHVVHLGHIKRAIQTKGELCVALGATRHIDDNIGHCETSREAGVMPLLYGDYGWQHDAPGWLARARNWEATTAYYDQEMERR